MIKKWDESKSPSPRTSGGGARTPTGGPAPAPAPAATAWAPAPAAASWAPAPAPAPATWDPAPAPGPGGRAQFYSIGPSGEHDFFSPEDNVAIAAAQARGDAALALPPKPYGSFEIRFGAAATSAKVDRPPASGIIQVNLANQNTRTVECQQHAQPAQASWASPAPAPVPGWMPAAGAPLPVVVASLPSPAPAPAPPPSLDAAMARALQMAGGGELGPPPSGLAPQSPSAGRKPAPPPAPRKGDSIEVWSVSGNSWIAAKVADMVSEKEAKVEYFVGSERCEKTVDTTNPSLVRPCAPSPAPAPEPARVEIIVPAGCAPGSTVKVTLPDGQMASATVPDDAVPGQRISVVVTPDPAEEPEPEPEPEPGLSCSICAAEFGEAEGVFCTPDASVESRHFFCLECFRQGVVSECAGPMGSFEKAFHHQTAADSPAMSSAAGCLPCFMFPNFCTVTQIAPEVIAQAVQDDEPSRTAYEKALARQAAKNAEPEPEPEPAFSSEESEDSDEDDFAMLSPSLAKQVSAGGTTKYHGLFGTKLVQLVHATLAAGATVLCPNCGMAVEKDDSCIHMDSCPCGAAFCYCCGRFSLRAGELISGGQPQPQVDDSSGVLQLAVDIPGCPRNPGGGEAGCDSHSTYLETLPGWDCFALDGESKGGGARNEFHRRRMAYFLRFVKECTAPDAWDQMVEENAELLEGMPTPGRRISWEEIDQASLPVIGNAVPTDVLRVVLPVLERLLPGCEPALVPAATALSTAMPKGKPTAQTIAEGDLLVCVKKARLRRTEDLSSKKCGNVLVGEVIRVRERIEVPVPGGEPVLRVRCGGGWTSVLTSSGNLLLERAEPGADETIVGRGWKRDAQKAARAAHDRLLQEREREINRARRLTAPADYDEATILMIIEAMGGNACQCPACGMVISKEGGDDQVMCGCEAQPAGGTLEKAFAGGGCGHQFNYSTLQPLGIGKPGEPANDRQWKFSNQD